MTLEDTIRIPKDRLGGLIGKKGEIKTRLQKQTKTKIAIDSENAEVTVKGNDENPIGFYTCLNIIKAIGRGFSAEHAFLLQNENYTLEIINIKQELNATQRELEQKKGRIIGTNGKTRSEIESKTNCSVSVYGKTVSILGEAEHVAIAKKAIEMLLQGASHTRVYSFLNQKQSFETFEI